MCQYRVAAALMFLIFSLLSDRAMAEDRSVLIDRAKRATALVDIQSREFGTAFCIDPSGVFVTNAHVVRDAVGGNKVVLVLQPGEAAQKVLRSRVLRTDDKQDLALLLAERVDQTVPLELGNSSGVYETAAVTAFGYPFGRLLAERGASEYPSITVSTGHVTSLRKLRGELQHLQLDASLNPGNSGGPVLDQNGKVVGIVQAGIYGSGVNLAIPVEKLLKFLETPEIIFQPPPVPSARRHEAMDFSFRVVAPAKSEVPLTVRLTLSNNGSSERTAETKNVDGIYHAMIIPVPPTQSPPRLRVIVEGSAGSVAGFMRDTSFRCGARQLRLGDVSKVEFAPEPTVILEDGTRVAGEITGLNSGEIDIGGMTMRVEFRNAPALRVVPSEEDARLSYRITVSRGNKTLAESSGFLALEKSAAMANVDVPPAVEQPPMALTPTQLTADKVEVRLPGPVDDVIMAGGGRYLLLPIKKLNKLAVFETGPAKITRYVTLPAADLLLTAGADRMFIALPGQKVLQRWSLATFQRELSAVLPVEGTPQAIAMGCNSRGPLLVECSSVYADGRSSLTLLDSVSLRPRQSVEGALLRMQFSLGATHVRASADGTVFCFWSPTISPTGLGVAVLDGSKIQSYYEHTSPGYVVPGPDGQFIFTSGAGVFTQKLRPIGTHDARRQIEQTFIPSTSPAYYIALSWSQPDERNQRKLSFSLRHIGNEQPLSSLPDLDELALEPGDIGARTDFTLEKRVVFMPEANLLITIPTTNDRLILRKFNLVEALEKNGIDYLFVNSTPVTVARAGDRYRYQLRIESKRGGVSYKVESGPEGVKITPSGMVTWQVPEDATDSSVIISVKDVSGQEIFHTFTVTVSGK